MTVKELIDRLNELNCPDYEVELSGGAELNLNNVRFANTGTKVILGNFDEIILGLSQRIKGLKTLISELRDCYYDIEDVLDNFSDIFDNLEELI